MPDVIDDANTIADLYLTTALRNRKVGIEINRGTGFCLWCDEDVPDGHRWCDALCRGHYEFSKTRVFP